MEVTTELSILPMPMQLLQWQSLHAVEGTPTRTEIVDGHARRVWCDAGGREVIEEYRITKMGHGAPLRTGGAEGYGAPGDHMLEVAICSTNTLRASGV